MQELSRWSEQLNAIVSWDNLKTNFVSWFMNACEQLSDALNTCLVTMIKTLVLGIGSIQDLKEFRMLSKTSFSNVKNQILVHVFMLSILWITYNWFDVSKIQTLLKILQTCWYSWCQSCLDPTHKTKVLILERRQVFMASFNCSQAIMRLVGEGAQWGQIRFKRSFAGS